MRKIRVTEPSSALWRQWRLDCEAATRDLELEVASGLKPSVKDIYKRKSIKESYFFSKGDPFFGKCAYCEVAIADYQHGDIEHFRPKLAVTDKNDTPVAHTGYYWLAYDWRNLLPSCIVCNEPKTINGKKVGKHNRFPVVGTHAKVPAELASEEPLLLHPVEDNPAEHLLVDSNTGLLGHQTPRGEACIEIFGLNLRDQLVTDRMNACRAARGLLTELIFGSKSKVLGELKSIRAGEKPFSLAQNTVIDELRDSLL